MLEAKMFLFFFFAKSAVAFMEVILVETKKILSTIGTFVIVGAVSTAGAALWTNVLDDKLIAIQEIIKEYQRQKTNQRSRKGGSARKPQQYHAEAEVII